MKYRVIACVLVIAILGTLALLSDESPPAAPAQSPASSDDKALKSLSIN